MKMIPLFKVSMNPDVDRNLSKVLHSGFIGEGPKVKEFEKELSDRTNNPNCLALSSGTHALTLALRLIKHPKSSWGKASSANIVSTSLTCFATNAAIITSGYDIVWADIQKESLNIDPESIRKRITPETKAIMVVHWGGYPCDMSEIRKISEEYNNLPVIEDGAHALGSFYKDHPIGDCHYSDFCMMSFQAIKGLNTIDGGALFTSGILESVRARYLRWFGINRESTLQDMRCKENIIEAGFKFHMNDVCATVGLSNFEIFDKNLKITKSNIEFYKKGLIGFSGIVPIQNKTDRVSSNWLFTVLVKDRTGFARKMGEKGIMVSQVHSRNDTHSCTEKYKTSLPNLDSVDNEYCCIPAGWWVTKEDREYILSSIKGGW